MRRFAETPDGHFSRDLGNAKSKLQRSVNMSSMQDDPEKAIVAGMYY
jgi:hypothetical protein